MRFSALAALLLAGCGQAAPKPAAAPADDAVARVHGETITRAQLDERASERLMPLRQQEYEARREALEQLLAERLFDQEARARGIGVEELLAREVAARAAPVSRREAEAFYAQNAPRLGGRTLQELLPEIEAALRQRNQAERREAFRKELQAKAGVAILLEPPRASVPVPVSAPALGGGGAPVTIVAFADYQCPYCHRAQETVDELLARYAGRLRLVHRDFPLDGRPRSFVASRAARCAGEQGKFWQYHSGLMKTRSALDDADLRGRAAALGLDASAFASCLASDRGVAEVRASVADGQRLGVNATPTFFINGRMLVGARPLQDFVQVIDEELARKGE